MSTDLARLRAWIIAAALIAPTCAWPQAPATVPDNAAHAGTMAAMPPGSTDTAKTARTAAPKDAYVYIGWPNDGEVIHSGQFHVWFGTRNFGVSPAGFSKPNTGHHHLLVDAPVPPLDQPIPNDKNHLHFGAGQTETVLELPPGRHTLQLLMGDGSHVPHDPPVISRRITITVRP